MAQKTKSCDWVKMAQNNIYEPSMSPNGAMVNPTNRGVRVNSGIADAANSLSQVAGGIASWSTDRLDETSRAWAANASSKADMAAQELFETKKRSATDGAPKFKEELLSDWEKYRDESLNNAPNGRAHELMSSHFDSVTESLSKNARQFQGEETDRWRAKMADDGIDADARLMSNQGVDMINSSVEKSLGKWSAYFKSLPMEPGVKQKLIDSAREKITNAANMRAIQVDPSGYLASNAMARQPDVLATDPKAPRGIRNNNPGNLRTDVFEGTVGLDDEGYGKFKTPEQGLRAMAKNLIVQQTKHGLNTVEGIIQKYAPPNENDTASYIKTVSAAIGVNPSDSLNLKDPATLQKLMTAMIKHENGVQPYSAAQVGAGVNAAIEGRSLPASMPQTQGVNDGTRSPSANTAFNLGTWEQQQKWIALAESEQNRLEAEKKKIATEANTLIGSVKSRMEAGYAIPDDELSVITQTVVQSGDPLTAKKWQDLQGAQDLTKSMQQLSPIQLQNIISTQLEPLMQRDGATESEKLQLDIGKKVLGNMTKAISSDPLSYAARIGMTVQPLDFNKPESMPARVASARAVADKYGIPVENAIFSQAEKVQFASSLETMPDTMKLELGKRMQAGFGDYFMGAVSKISEKDPIFSHAAFLSSISPQNDSIALDILRGQTILKAQPSLKPKPTEKQASLSEIGGAFEYMPKALPGIIEATDALYVKRAGVVESFDQNIYDQALLDVMGAKDGKGGIGIINGKELLLPQEISQDDFERGIEAMTADELAEMSMGGTPPIYGKDKARVNGKQLLNNATFRSIAYGKYAAFDENDRPVTSDNGLNGQFVLQLDSDKFLQIVKEANARAAKESMPDAPGGYGSERAGGGLQ